MQWKLKIKNNSTILHFALFLISRLSFSHINPKEKSKKEKNFKKIKKVEKVASKQLDLNFVS